ncbi:unnamed protein product, partial [Ectocarpus sp. 8 AP-2014]
GQAPLLPTRQGHGPFTGSRVRDFEALGAQAGEARPEFARESRQEPDPMEVPSPTSSTFGAAGFRAGDGAAAGRAGEEGFSLQQQQQQQPAWQQQRERHPWGLEKEGEGPQQQAPRMSPLTWRLYSTTLQVK